MKDFTAVQIGYVFIVRMRTAFLLKQYKFAYRYAVRTRGLCGHFLGGKLYDLLHFVPQRTIVKFSVNKCLLKAVIHTDFHHIGFQETSTYRARKIDCFFFQQINYPKMKGITIFYAFEIYLSNC